MSLHRSTKFKVISKVNNSDYVMKKGNYCNFLADNFQKGIFTVNYSNDYHLDANDRDGLTQCTCTTPNKFLQDKGKKLKLILLLVKRFLIFLKII